MPTIEERRRRMKGMWRCYECGAPLPEVYAMPLPVCEAHPRAQIVEWTARLAAAYRVQLERAERGEEPEKHDGMTGVTFDRAARFVARWGAPGGTARGERGGAA